MPPKLSLKRQAAQSACVCQKTDCSRTSRWRHNKRKPKTQKQKQESHPHTSSDTEEASNSDSESKGEVLHDEPCRSADARSTSPSAASYAQSDAVDQFYDHSMMDDGHSPKHDREGTGKLDSDISEHGDASSDSVWSSDLESSSTEPDDTSGSSEEDSDDLASSDSSRESGEEGPATLHLDAPSDEVGEEGHARLHLDAPSDEVVLFASSQVTVRGLAQVLGSLQASSKLSDRDMVKIVALVKAILPPGHVVQDLQQLRKLLHALLPPVQAIHACARDHCLFIGALELARECPHCRLPRYYVDKSGKSKPVKVFRYIPLDAQMELLFATPDAARSMRLDPACCANASRDDLHVTDITGSIGFKEKVFDSKFMTDIRNPIALLATDGFNPSARIRASKLSMWPFLMTFANRDRAIRNKFENILLVGIVPGHYYVDGRKKYGGPKSLNSYTEFILNEFRKLNGLMVRDASYPRNDARSNFRMSTMLLGTVSDFDGLGKLLNLVGAGGARCCPKCHIRGTWFRSVKTRVFGQSYEEKFQPRTHAEMKILGARSANLMHRKPKERYARHVTKTGISDLSPLANQPDFDCVDQCFLDLMHIIFNIVNLHTMARINGRCSLPSVPVNQMKAKSREELAKFVAHAPSCALFGLRWLLCSALF